MVKTMPSNAGGVGSTPGQGTKIPHASGPKIQNKSQKQYCNKFNKDLKNGPHLKKKNQGCIEQFLFWVQTHFPLDQLFCILSLQPHLESQLSPFPTSLGVL